MCKVHSHHNLISEIHSNREREFCYPSGVPIKDDDNVAKKRKELDMTSANSLIALGDALAYQMRYNEALVYYEKAREVFPDSYVAHRKCAIRYMSSLKIDDAEREFLWCESRTDDKLDITYRLALCAYYKGDYALAKQRFLKCYPLAKSNGEMYVAVLYWHLHCLVRLKEYVKEALKFYYDGLDGGHHIGYMQTVKLFLTGDLSVEDVIHAEDELNLSIYRYGLYAYLKYKGKEQDAICEFDEMLKLDTYFSSFAYIGAYLERQRLRDKSLNDLREFFKKNNKLALAFSGGTDSAFLLSIAKQSGADIKAYFVQTEFQPTFEVNDAKRLANKLSAECEFAEISVLDSKNIAENPKDRCYHCKRRLFETLIAHAGQDGYFTIIDGTNASDDFKDRPGMRALCELRVSSPLREAGLTKEDVRILSKERGLFTWDKPSYSCLATRVATGERITNEKLDIIEKAEKLFFEYGYSDFRVRYADRCAKIEISKSQNDKFQKEKYEIFNALAPYFEKIEQSDILR